MVTTIKNTTATKLAIAATATAMVVGVLFTLASPRAEAAALTQSQITSIVSLLSSFGADATTIANVTASLNGQPTSGGSTGGSMTSSVCPFTWTTNLMTGSNSADVMKLQKFLNSSSDTMVSASGTGSAGMESNYYGAKTAAAVTKFQEKYAADILTPVGLTKGTGKFLTSSRAKANMLCATASNPSNPGTPSTGTGLMVSSASQPANGYIVKNASRVPFTKFTVTAGNDGDVTVNSVVVQRTGLIARGAFQGVVLLDDQGVILGQSKTLNSNDQAVIGDKVVVARGTTKTFTVAGNFGNLTSPTDYNGQNGGLNVVSVNTSAAVSGSLPIMGAMHTVNGTLTIGTATVDVSSFDPNTARSKEVGSTGYIFSGVRVTAGSAEDVRVRNVRFNQAGSANLSDVSNLVVVVDGVSYPAVSSADGDYASASFGNGIVIAQGLSKDIYLKGDISGSNASGRTVEFDLENASDLYLTGEKYGYGINPTAGSTGSASTASEFTSGTPFFSGSVVSVTGGAATTISRSSTVPAQNIAVNVPNQPLGGFDTNFRGEPVTIQGMIFDLSTTSAATFSDPITNISLVDKNGTVVAGPVDATYNSTIGKQVVTFTDSVTFPVGLNTYTLKGKIPSSFSNGIGIVASTSPSMWTNPKGDVTGDSISLTGNSSFSLNTMTVKTAALTTSVSTNPAAQTITAGIQKFVFANYQFDATASGEDVRFSSIKLLPAFSTISGSAITNCQLWDGSTALNTGSNVVNGPTTATDATFTLDNSFVVTKGASKTLSLACDIAGGSTGSLTWGITMASSTVVVTGVTSSVAVNDVINASAGQTMTIGNGSFTVLKDASSPSYAVASGNSTGVTLGVLKFRASNEDQYLRKIGLQLTNTASSSGSNFVGNAVNIYDGTTLVGTATFNGSATTAVATLTGNGVTLTKDSDKILTVKADLSSIGTSQSGTEGALVAVDYDGATANSSTNGTYAVGAASGANIAAGSTSDTAMDGIRTFRTFPTLAKASVPTNVLVNGSVSLLRFTVTADAKGDLGVYQFGLTLATSTATVTAINIFGYTDAGYSQPVSGVTSGGQLSSSNYTGNTVKLVVTNSGGTATPLQIPAGTTRYFDVRGTVAGAVTGSSVQTTLTGDSSYPALSTLMGVATSLASGNSFVWSPNATGTTVVSGLDWTNGFGLVGLPSSGMSPEVLSK